MRIGILAEGFAEWQGGNDFLRLVCDSLRQAEPVELVLLYPRDTRGETVDKASEIGRRWLGEMLQKCRAGSLRTLASELGGLSDRPKLERLQDTLGKSLAIERFHGDAELEALARSLRLDGLLPSFRALDAGVRTPWLGYLFDFQHRHLPHLFSAVERDARDARFAAMAARARQVIVNSQAVAADAARFLGMERAALVPLPFGSAPAADWLADQPGLLAKYGLPSRYFLVSNQFWTHKNHRRVFEALPLLPPEVAAPAVVCTGSTLDARDPGYFPSLQRFLDENGLASKVRILGHIPKRDQIEIMKGALAVVQPTLFEGGPGGGAVYDAVALGVPALVSDLPVNRELDGSGLSIRFFDPGSAAALAGLMSRCLCEPAPRRPEPAALLAAGRERQRAVGQTLLQALKAALQPPVVRNAG